MDINKEIEKLETIKDIAENKAKKLNIQHKIDILLKKKQSYDND